MRRPWTAHVVLLAAVVGLIAVFTPFVVFAWLVHQGAEVSTDTRRAAEARVATQARDYANAVAAEGGSGVTDARLYELSNHRGLVVVQIVRGPELSVVVDSTATYSAGAFGTSRLSVCYRLDFSGPGTSAARHKMIELPSCRLTPTVPSSSD